MRHSSASHPRFAGIVMAFILSISAAVAVADTFGNTTTGNCEAADGQHWTFNGQLHYRSWDTSGQTEMYFWDYGNAAVLNLSQEVHYVDHLVRYRAAIIYDTTTVVWQSAPQNMMQTRVLEGNSGDMRTWSPRPDSWESSLTNTVEYKVQSAKDDQGGSIEARSVALLHNQ